MRRIYELLVIEVFFCALGTPLGILIFWIGMGAITYSLTGNSLTQGGIVGLGGAPFVIFFGFLVGLPISAINGLVFWVLIKLHRLKDKIHFTGFLAGVCFLTILSSVAFITDVLIAGRDRDGAAYILLTWLIISAGITGIIMSSLVKRRICPPNIAVKRDAPQAARPLP
jgi:hypothetical protein